MERMTATNPVEALSLEAIVSDMLGMEVSSMEVMPALPTVLRFPRLKQTMAKEKKPTSKKKRKKPVPMCMSLRIHMRHW